MHILFIFQGPRTRPRRLAWSGEVLFAVGGWCSGDAINTVERYSSEHESWKVVSPMAKRRCGVGVATLNNLLYAICKLVFHWLGGIILCVSTVFRTTVMSKLVQAKFSPGQIYKEKIGFPDHFCLYKMVLPEQKCVSSLTRVLNINVLFIYKAQTDLVKMIFLR